MNTVRSPMCEGLLKQFCGAHLYVDSAGVKSGQHNFFMEEVMMEIGINMSTHHAKTFEDLYDESFDMIIALSPEAQHHAVEQTRTHACDVVFWHIFDPTIIEGSRDIQLEAYRKVRNQIAKKIEEFFGPLLPT